MGISMLDTSRLNLCDVFLISWPFWLIYDCYSGDFFIEEKENRLNNDKMFLDLCIIVIFSVKKITKIFYANKMISLLT
jgi:hypothetical protein